MTIRLSLSFRKRNRYRLCLFFILKSKNLKINRLIMKRMKANIFRWFQNVRIEFLTCFNYFRNDRTKILWCMRFLQRDFQFQWFIRINDDENLKSIFYDYFKFFSFKFSSKFNESSIHRLRKLKTNSTTFESKSVNFQKRIKEVRTSFIVIWENL